MRDPKIRLPIKLWFTCSLFLLAVSLFVAPGVPAGEKMKPEEVVAKHIESIGAIEKLASSSSRVISGTCRFSSRVRGNNSAQGPAVLASMGDKSLIGLAFGLSEYPFEKLGFNGKELTVAYIRPGIRSILGDFLLTHKVVFKEGLFGGILSSAWPLLDLSVRKPKLEYAGLKEINGRGVHVIKYRPKGGSDLEVKLFFDSETYQHVRTEYERLIPSQMGSSPDQSARKRETRYNFTEEFSDFKKENGLTLPHSFRFELVIMAATDTGQFEWNLNLEKFDFNQPIDPNSFTINTN
jgi:hypothetical protein